MFEFFTTWKYLYNPSAKPYIVLLLFVSALLSALSLGVFIWADRYWQLLGLISFGITILTFLIFFLLRFFSVFTTISIFSVLLGTSVLTIVWTVSSGFQKEFKEKILGVNGHILFMPYGNLFIDYQKPLKIARLNKDVIEAAPFNLNEMLVIAGKKHAGILIKGIVPELAKKVLDLPKQMKSGNIDSLKLHTTEFIKEKDFIDDDSEETADSDKNKKISQIKDCDKNKKIPGIILGAGLAERLGVKKGDAVTVISPLSTYMSSMSSGSVPRVTNVDFCVTGIFFAGFDEYDQKLAYAHINVTKLFNPFVNNKESSIFGIEMRLKDMDNADSVAINLKKELEKQGITLRVITWGQLNPQVFQNLQFHKTVIWILLFFLISVSAFGVLSALYMLVIDKKKEIALLKALGAKDSSVGMIFVLSGVIIGAIGLILGQFLGYTMSKMLNSYSFPLDPEVYIINRLPVNITFQAFLMISVTTIVLCTLSTFFPAVKAARTRPVEALIHNKG